MKGKNTLSVGVEKREPLAFVLLILSSLRAEKLMHSSRLERQPSLTLFIQLNSGCLLLIPPALPHASQKAFLCTAHQKLKI